MSPPPVPRLLVSVRDVAEARAAAAGGADIIDFKNPAQGPLGRADFRMIAEAAEALRANVLLPPRPLSAALGEVREAESWVDAEDLHLPADVGWLKIGLAGLGRSPNWVDEWLQVRREIEQRLRQPVRWVAVAYADVAAAAAPAIDEIIEAAIETACAGVLVDTWDKAGGRLLDYLERTQLIRMSRSVRNRGLFLALAGRLRSSDLVRLCDVPANIIAVRSAACAGDDRQAGVCSDRVRSLRQQIHTLCGGRAVETDSPAATANRTAPVAPSGD